MRTKLTILLALVIALMPLQSAEAAISRSGSGAISTSGNNNASGAATCSSGSTILVANLGVQNNSSATFTPSMTYGGTPMTLVATEGNGTGNIAALFILYNPATSGTLSSNAGQSSGLLQFSQITYACYSGVRTSGQPNGQATLSANPSSFGSVSVTASSSVNDAWFAMGSYISASMTPGASTTQVVAGASDITAFYDSNTSRPTAGNWTFNLSNPTSGGRIFRGVMIAMEPAPPAPPRKLKGSGLSR